MLQHTTHGVNMLVNRVPPTTYHTGYLVTNLIDTVITPDHNGNQLSGSNNNHLHGLNNLIT